MNRRGFIGSILGVVAWSKSKLGVPLYPVIGNDGKLHGYSPAASAIQPTCKQSSRKYLLGYGGQTMFSVLNDDGSLADESVVYIEHEINGGRYIEVSSMPVGAPLEEMMAAIPNLPIKPLTSGISVYAMTKAFMNRGEIVPIGLHGSHITRHP